MATPQEKLAQSLEVLRQLQTRKIRAIRSSDLSRTHRERLLANGFLQEVMKGWYIPARPDELAGDSTTWYASFWAFCAAYLGERFGAQWCMSPEQSLSLQVGNRTVPRQLLVRSPTAGNKVTELPHGTSLLEVRAAIPEVGDILDQDGIRLFSVAAGLIACPAGFYARNPIDARAALAMIRDASELLARLLAGGHSIIAGRLAGALRNIGRNRIADDILQAMRAAGYDVRENDPFVSDTATFLPTREISPYVNRLRLMWQQMRAAIIDNFPRSPGIIGDSAAYIQKVDGVFVSDAYNSLSIEGYQVIAELIERVRNGQWNPEANEADRDLRNALAARGYWQAYQKVKESVGKVLTGATPGTVADEDHAVWYREMFAPGVAAGLLRPADLAGYRHDQVFIRRSMHVPPRHEAVRDLMPAFFELLREETEPAVRVVLGHFGFVFIHPYMDGNGRMGRFLMNLMLAAGGYPWTVVPMAKRQAYLDALEEASVRQNIEPFTRFLAQLVEQGLREG